MYDVNPINYGTRLALCVDNDNNEIDFDLAISTAKYYNISKVKAEDIVREIKGIVNSSWRRVASSYGLSRSEIEKKAPAFEKV